MISRSANCVRMVAVSLAFFGLAASDWTITTNADGIDAVRDGQHVRVIFRAPDIVRVSRTSRAAWSNSPSIAVLPAADPAVAKVETGTDAVTIATAPLRVRFDLAKGTVRFADAAGKVLLDEAAHSLEARQLGKEDVQAVSQHWLLAAGEALYGMGDVLDDGLDLRRRLAKTPLNIKVDNIIDPMPCWVSTAGYGLLWDCPAPAVAAVADDQLGISCDCADEEDYYLIAAPRLDDAVRGLRRLTGTAPMPPRWAFGYVQSKERYKSQAEIIDVAKHLRASRFPADAVVQDWRYWGEFGWNGMRFDPEIFPDPAGMMRELHAMDMHLLLSVWSNFPPGSTMYETLKPKRLLSDKPVFGDAFLYDTWSPEARDAVWARVRKYLLPAGIDGWWLDHTDLMGYQDGKGSTARGQVQRVFNSFVVGACQPYYQGQRHDAPDKRVMILTRSIYPGVQRFGAFYWSGDVHADWPTLRRHQAAALNTCLSGIPYWNSDIGGFFISRKAFPDPNSNPAYRELYTRWFQFGVFTALCRSHGTEAPREPWQFGKPGEEVYDTLLAFANLRYRLLPYIYSQAWQVTSDGGTLMRALPMDFPGDAALSNLAGQWMFGPELMVTPVTAPLSEAATTRVVLPQGVAWYDFWTGARLEGRRDIEQAVPLSTMPLHVRAGSILPLGPIVQHTGESGAGPLELRIYPGGDASFTLYDDAGDGYGYERGERSTVLLIWDDGKRTLRIGERQGGYPGMAPTRRMDIVLVRPGVGGVAPAPSDATVSYTGKEVTLRLP